VSSDECKFILTEPTLFRAWDNVSRSPSSLANAMAFSPHSTQRSGLSHNIFSCDILLNAIAFAGDAGWLESISTASSPNFSAFFRLPLSHHNRDRKRRQPPLLSVSFFPLQRFNNFSV